MSRPARADGVSRAAKVRRFTGKVVAACAFTYPAVLVIWAASLSFIGEGWWVTAAALYLPGLVLGLPLPFLVIALWVSGGRRLLWTQGVAAFLVVFPIMGFVTPWPASRVAGQTFRLLSFNVNSGFSGAQPIVDAVMASSPDVVLLEEAPPWAPELANLLRTHFPFVETSTQFIIASRFRIDASTDPEKIPFYGRARSPRFMRYAVSTPLGPLAIYCVHPLSPRGVLHIHRFRGAVHQLLTGQLLAGDPEQDVQANASLRALQIEHAAAMAGHESMPVLIAGDTNLPGLSAALRRWFSGYQDGFRVSGWGFGYTFPSKHPFLRLDRILASDELRLASFQVACPGVSDHLCVVADVGARQ